MKVGVVVNIVAAIDDVVAVAAAAEVVVVADGRLYFLFPGLWVLSSELAWSLLLCRMYLRGHSGSSVSTMAWIQF
jgi:hypothetical protein